MFDPRITTRPANNVSPLKTRAVTFCPDIFLSNLIQPMKVLSAFSFHTDIADMPDLHNLPSTPLRSVIPFLFYLYSSHNQFAESAHSVHHLKIK